MPLTLQMLSASTEEEVRSFLGSLVEFQNRSAASDPLNAKRKQRVVLGIKQV